MKSLLIFLGVGMAIISVNAQQAHPPLIPLPQSVEWIPGEFALSAKTLVAGSSSDLSLYIRSRLKELTGVETKTDSTKGYEGRIELHVDGQLQNAKRESYILRVSKNLIVISGANDEGLLRGMQTLFQLIPASSKARRSVDVIGIPCCNITDAPAFSWRGLNLDCSRHFMSKEFVKRYIDILAYYKFNVFHWHLTDDQGWRIQIRRYPRLTDVGAWRKEGDGTIYGGFYTQEDVREIVAYAEGRHITVVPEIEMPGHTLAALASYPENSCTGGPFDVTTIWGVHKDILCPGRDSTFIFVQNVLDEICTLFPGKYVHIGGDEAPTDRWKTCPKCQARMRAEGLKNERELQGYFEKRVARYLRSKGKVSIGWDEILQGGLPDGTIVQSWQSFQGAVAAAKLGHQTICSPASHTYLNVDPDDLDLRVAYSFMPIPEELSSEESAYVVGGEANLWTEHAPQETVDAKLFPRLLALSEVFWSNPRNGRYDDFAARVRDTYDDLAALGISHGRESKLITPSTSYNASRGEFSIGVRQEGQDIDVRYTIDGGEPDTSSPRYQGPITVKKTSTVRISAFRDNHDIGKHYALSFVFHKALNASITLGHAYEERYRAGGSGSVVDGVRGTADFRDGCWQGFEGVDFEATIDLGKEKEISRVAPRFYFDSNSWIFLPVRVDVSLSTDNIHYGPVKSVENSVRQESSEILLKDFPVVFDGGKARFIRISAESIKKCPEWHPGAGAPAWLFIDEIVVE